MSSKQPTYAGTTGNLPDGLAFLNPNRSRFWLTLREYDEPVTATELERDTEWSSATVYRMLEELADYDLAESVTRIDATYGPREAYRAVDPTAGGDESDA